ncbi:MAG: DsbA family protein [Gammaproteobacteria bacterium]
MTPADHIQGDENAPLTLVEYGDYECPYCGLAYPIVKRIQKHFGKRLRFVFRNFPIVDSHPHAGIAAITAEFAATQHKFWEMHDLLYENQNYLDMPNLVNYAKSLGLSESDLQIAINNEQFADKIQKDFTGGVRSGVNGTPTFFINGNRLDGSFDYENMLDALNNAKEK